MYKNYTFVTIFFPFSFIIVVRSHQLLSTNCQASINVIEVPTKSLENLRVMDGGWRYLVAKYIYF